MTYGPYASAEEFLEVEAVMNFKVLPDITVSVEVWLKAHWSLFSSKAAAEEASVIGQGRGQHGSEM